MRHPNIPPLITIDEAAQLLTLTVADIEEGVHAGDIPVTAHNGQLWIDAHTLLADFGIWPGQRIGLVPSNDFDRSDR